jgi:hypothetical protein
MKKNSTVAAAATEFLCFFPPLAPPFSRCLIGFCAVNETGDVAYTTSSQTSERRSGSSSKHKERRRRCHDISIHDKMKFLSLSPVFDNLLFPPSRPPCFICYLTSPSSCLRLSLSREWK